MNTLLQWAATPAGGILWKWTALLALGWVAHGWMRRGNARWRLILWRSLLVFSLGLPLVSWLSLPALTISIPEAATQMPLPADAASSPVEAKVAAPNSAKSPAPAVLNGPVLGQLKALPAPVAGDAFPWEAALLAVWMAGIAFGVARLTWWQIRLARLRRQAGPPDAILTGLTANIRARLRPVASGHDAAPAAGGRIDSGGNGGVVVA
jgi:hypothetical protein